MSDLPDPVRPTRFDHIVRIAIYHVMQFLALGFIGFLLLVVESKGERIGLVFAMAVTVAYLVWSGLRHAGDPTDVEFGSDLFSGQDLFGHMVQFHRGEIENVNVMSYRYGSGRNYWMYFRIRLGPLRRLVYVDRRNATVQARAELDALCSNIEKGFSPGFGEGLPEEFLANRVNLGERELTPQEREWLVLGLQTLATGEAFGGGRWIECESGSVKSVDSPVDPEPYLSQVSSLRVIGDCPCGEPKCHTVRFQHYERGKSVAIVCHHTSDGRQLIINVHEGTGLLAELEII
jgi:hypothetical protein